MVAHMRHCTCAFLLLIPLAACDDARPQVPTAPTATTPPPAPAPPPAPPPTGITVMRGGVLDTAFRRIPGAFVEVLDGPDAHATAAVQSDGLVTIYGTFERTTRFRAGAEGHESVVQTCPEPCNGFNQTVWIFFQLRPLSPPAIDLAGAYTLTVTASASCSMLPEESRSRSYGVTLTARMRPGTADVLGYGLSFESEAVVDWLRQGYMGVAGNDVRSYWTSGEFDQPGIIESLGDKRYVTFMGTVEASLNPGSRSSQTLTFVGSVDYLELESPPTRFGPGGRVLSRQSCTASDHRVLLTAR
jgi:hypothetical protein